MVEEKDKAKKNSYEKAIAAYDKAMKDFRKKDYPKAVASFQNFLQDFPDEKEINDRN